ncbi:hypothetical protein [Actinoplanes teichomyceticus]|uniref:Uncharacterized protein n=1 Tax=Actinoplanes teichomyceticus TaxID=1867 RepID=A0A561WII6_ACTTI|nr:hypothetical protein [Actinoplanes teichomyceticus]TWG23668.1 hypothetical protein FHX34_102218 [Actinoplanes teichomyceticus]GIF11709.1 hypothetical protein Ate01nite_17410 [Actinoplanes teichomyceticus]
MSRSVTPPYQQNDPSPGVGDRRGRRRVVIFVVVAFVGAALLATGSDLESVLLALLGLGLVAASVARWVVDDVPLPGAISFVQDVNR